MKVIQLPLNTTKKFNISTSTFKLIQWKGIVHCNNQNKCGLKKNTRFKLQQKNIADVFILVSLFFSLFASADL